MSTPRGETGDTQSSPESAAPTEGRAPLKKLRSTVLDVAMPFLHAAIEADSKWREAAAFIANAQSPETERNELLALALAHAHLFPMALTDVIGDEEVRKLGAALTRRSFRDCRPIPPSEYYTVYREEVTEDKEQLILLSLSEGTRRSDVENIPAPEKRRLVEFRMSTLRTPGTHTMWHEHHLSLFLEHRASQPTLQLLRRLVSLPVLATSTFHRRIKSDMRFDSQRSLVQDLVDGVLPSIIMCFSFDNFQLMYSSVVNLVRESQLFTDVAVKMVKSTDPVELIVNNDAWPLLGKADHAFTRAAAMSLVARIEQSWTRSSAISAEFRLPGLGDHATEVMRFAKQDDTLANILTCIRNGKLPAERRSSGAKGAFGLAALRGDESSDEMIASTVAMWLAVMNHDTVASNRGGKRLVVIGVDTGPFFNLVRLLRYAASLVDPERYGYAEFFAHKAWLTQASPSSSSASSSSSSSSSSMAAAVSTTSSADVAVEATQVAEEDGELELEELSSAVVQTAVKADDPIPAQDVVWVLDGEDVAGGDDATQLDASASSLAPTEQELGDPPLLRRSSAEEVAPSQTARATRKLKLDFKSLASGQETAVVPAPQKGRPTLPPNRGKAQTNSASSSSSAGLQERFRIAFSSPTDTHQSRADALAAVFATDWHLESELLVQRVHEISAVYGNVAVRRRESRAGRHRAVAVRHRNHDELPNDLMSSFFSMPPKDIDEASLRELLMRMGADDDSLKAGDAYHVFEWFLVGASKGVIVALGELRATLHSEAWPFKFDTRNFFVMPEIWHIGKTGFEFLYMCSTKDRWGVLSCARPTRARLETTNPSECRWRRGSRRCTRSVRRSWTLGCWFARELSPPTRIASRAGEPRRSRCSSTGPPCVSLRPAAAGTMSRRRSHPPFRRWTPRTSSSRSCSVCSTTRSPSLRCSSTSSSGASRT